MCHDHGHDHHAHHAHHAHHDLHHAPMADHELQVKLQQRARHRGFGPGGFGGPGAGFGGPGGGFGPGGPRGGRRRKRGEIRDAILHLLESRSMHGYEMIQEIEQRSGGRWAPSPGSVYPMLQMLEDEGLIAHKEQDGRKVYSLTDAGGKHVADTLAEHTPPWEPREGEVEDPHHRMFAAGGQLMMAARQVVHVGDATQIDAAIAILEAARRDLYGLLAGDAGGDGK